MTETLIGKGAVMAKEKLKITQGCSTEWVGHELVITLPHEDIVVLNESAGVIAEAACCGEDPVKALCSKFEVPAHRAELESNRLIRRLQVLGIFQEPYACRQPETHVSRRLFVAGVAAFGVSLLSSGMALGEESAETATKVYNGSPLGEWEGSSKEVWVDSLGSESSIPADLSSIAPYGPYARAMLESIGTVPIANVTARGMHASTDGSVQVQAAAIAGSVESASSINQALVAEEKPSLILDVGDSLDRLSDDAALGVESGEQQVPVVHMMAGIQEVPQAFRTLADLLDAPYANDLADYTAQILVTFAQGREQLSGGTMKRIYYGQGVDGLSTRFAGTLLDDICKMVGLENIASSFSLEESSQVDPSWVEDQKPDLIVVSSPGFSADNEARELIRSIWLEPPFSGVAHIVPCEPFSWLDGSPLTMQTLGALWLANLAYPDVYDYDMADVVVDYFDRFFHLAIGRDEAIDLLNVGNI